MGTLAKQGKQQDFEFCYIFSNLLCIDPGGIRRRAWGKVHMMRSGKRGDAGQQDDDVQYQIPEDEEDFGSVVDMNPDTGVERADLGIHLEALDNSRLRRVSRSGDKWGGVHMLRTGKRSSSQVPDAEDGGFWGWKFLRSLRNVSGLSRRGGRRSLFGGGHMMRSGKRSSWRVWRPKYV